MRALSIRQPYAELILRGIKTVEYRSRPTRIIDEPFYIYAACPKSGDEKLKWSTLTPSLAGRREETGVLVGTAVIARCTRENGHFEWHLRQVKRLARPRRPNRMPQPVWFNPF